ncbi:MAG: glycosyltransferase family 4 protein [Ignavibacteria bacterium]|nr:glycosyltransferase family 4 protein [Ignavibacteria bacterium]
MRSRICIFTEHYYPDESATGYILTRIAEGICAQFHVQVFTKHLGRGVEPSSGNHHIRNQVHVQRCRGTHLDKNRVANRIVNIITLSLAMFWRGVFEVRRDDVVLAVTNPPTMPFVVMMVCLVKRARYVLLIHDVYPDVLVATSLIRSGDLLARLLDWLSSLNYRNAVGVIVLGRDMKERVLRKTTEIRDRIHLIPNWADTGEIAPAGKTENRLLKEHALCDKFVVQYSGNMGRTHDLETLLGAATMLSNDANIHFLVLGAGAKRKSFEDAVRSAGLKNVTILHPEARDHLDVLLAACDIAIIPFIGGMSGISVPSRMYNIMAAGRPILAVADEDSELGLVVREEEIGWVVPTAQPRRLAETIREIRLNPGRLTEMGKRARQAAESKYTFPAILAQVRKVLTDAARMSGSNHASA